MWFWRAIKLLILVYLRTYVCVLFKLSQDRYMGIHLSCLPLLNNVCLFSGVKLTISSYSSHVNLESRNLDLRLIRLHFKSKLVLLNARFNPLTTAA